MARPRKNPFGERKDTGIGYDGTRTNNPFARPTKTRKRRDQWDLANQANIIFEQKQAAKQRAEEARERARLSREATAERARKLRQEQQWLFNNPKARDEVADFFWDENGMNVMYKDEKSLGYFENKRGDIYEKVRDKNGKITKQNPYVRKGFKTDKRTGEEFVFAKVPGQRELKKRTLRSNLAKREEYLNKQALAQGNAEKSIRDHEASIRSQDIREKRTELERAEKQYRHLKKIYDEGEGIEKDKTQMDEAEKRVLSLQNQLDQSVDRDNLEKRRDLDLQEKISRINTNLDLLEYGMRLPEESANTKDIPNESDIRKKQRLNRGINGAWYEGGNQQYEGLYSPGEKVFPTTVDKTNKVVFSDIISSFVYEKDGKHYVIPTANDEKQISEEEALETANVIGLDLYPKFESKELAEGFIDWIKDGKVNSKGEFEGPAKINNEFGNLNVAPKQDATKEEDQTHAIGEAVNSNTSAAKKEIAIKAERALQNPTKENIQAVQEAVQKKNNRKPLVSKDVYQKLGPKAEPAGQSFETVLENLSETFANSSGEELHKLKMEAYNLQIKEVYSELQSKLPNVEAIEPVVTLLNPGRGVNYGYKEGQIEPKDSEEFNQMVLNNAIKELDVLAKQHITNQVLDDFGSPKSKEVKPSKRKLSQRHKSLLGKFVTGKLGVDLSKDGKPASSAEMAKWFDENVDLEAYFDTKNKLDDLGITWKESVGISTVWNHIPLDLNTGLGFKVRKDPKDPTGFTYQYKVDDQLTKTPEAILTQTAQSFYDKDGHPGEDHINFVIKNGVDAYEDVGAWKDSWNRASSTLTKNVYSMLNFAGRTAAYVWGSPNADEYWQEQRKKVHDTLDRSLDKSVATDLKAKYDMKYQVYTGAADAAGQLLTFHIASKTAGATLSKGTLVPKGTRAMMASKGVSKLGMKVAPGIKYLNKTPILGTKIGKGAGGLLGGYYGNYAYQMDNMLYEAVEAGMDPAEAFKELWLPGMVISGVDTASDWFITRGGSVLKGLLPKSTYNALLKSAIGRVGMAGTNLVGKVGSEAGTEGFQTYLENVIASQEKSNFFGAGYDPDRDPMEDVLVSMLIGGLIGGGAGTKAFFGETFSARSAAREYRANLEGLESVDTAAKGGESAKNELNEATSQENTKVDIHDQAKTHIDNLKSLAYESLGIDANKVGSIISNANVNPATQDDIINAIIQGGDPIYGAAAIGAAYPELQILGSKEVEKIRQMLEEAVDATPQQLEKAQAVIEGAVFVAREVESVLNTGKVTNEIFIEPLVELGVLTVSEGGTLKVNTNAARLLPPNLRQRIKDEVDKGETSNVEAPFEGDNVTSERINDLVEEGKNLFDEATEEISNREDLLEYQVAVGGIVLSGTIKTTSPEKAQEIAEKFAKQMDTDPSEVVITQINETPTYDESDFKPGKKVEEVTEIELGDKKVPVEDYRADLEKRYAKRDTGTLEVTKEIAEEDLNDYEDPQITAKARIKIEVIDAELAKRQPQETEEVGDDGLTADQRETLAQERDEQEVAEQTAQEEREAVEDEAGIRPVTRTGEFGTGRPGTGEFGQDKPTGQNRSDAVDILDDQQTTQTPQGNVQDDPTTFPGEAEGVRQREEEKEEDESIQEEDATSEEELLSEEVDTPVEEPSEQTSPLNLPVEDQQSVVDQFNETAEQQNKGKIKLVDMDSAEAEGRVNTDFFKSFEDATGVNVVVVEYEGDISELTPDQQFGGVAIDQNTIIVNIAASKDQKTYAGHELTHAIRMTDEALYQELKGILKKNLRAYPKIIDSVYKAGYMALGEQANKTPEQVWDMLEEEAIANIMGDMFSDPKFWDKITNKDRKLVSKIIDAIFRAIDKITEKISGDTTKGYNTKNALDGYDEIRGVFADTISKTKNFKRNSNVKNTGHAEAKHYALDSQQQFFNYESKPARDKVKEVNTKVKDKIEDFGQKIGGAKKDLWESYREKINVDIGDDSELTLSKHFPEPAYKTLLDKGANPDSLATLKALRDLIPPKPRGRRQGVQLRKWISAFKAIRDIARTIVNDPSSETVKSIDRMLLDDGKADDELVNGNAGVLSETTKVSRQIKLYRAVGYPGYNDLKGWTTGYYEGVHHDENGRLLDNPVSALVAIDNGKYRPRNPKSFKTNPDEAIADLANQLQNLDRTEEDEQKKRESLLKKFGLYRNRQTRKIYIARKIGRNVVKLQDGFDSAREGTKYLQENLDDLDRKFKEMQEVEVRNKENRPRIGKAARKVDENIDPERFNSRFGFRGVEFGNYVEGARRQEDLNNAYDALNDLADVLDLPAQSLSLNGTLGLAFGARGSGGRNAAMAHYEPIKVAINLTKKKGAGSLAHEWFHALDNYFQRLNIHGRADITPVGELLTEQRRGPRMARADVVQAFNHLRFMFDEVGTFAERAKKIDELRASPYWNTPVEKAARAFETYVVDKLEEKGVSNDYLANIKRTSGAYPTKEEMAQDLEKSFDRLFEVMKYKPTEKGMMLYALDRDPVLTQGAMDLRDGKITNKEYRDLVKERKPFVQMGPPAELPDKDEFKDTLFEVQENGQTIWTQKKQGDEEKVNKAIKDGTKIRARIDIPVFNKSQDFLQKPFYMATAHLDTSPGKAHSYLPYVYLENPTFKVNRKGASRVAAGKSKFPLATVVGTYKNINSLPKGIETWTEVGYDPTRSSEFIDVKTNLPVLSGKNALQVNNRVFVEDAQLMPQEEFDRPFGETQMFALDPNEEGATTGININDSTQPFTDQILSGKKTIETRNTNSLKGQVGKRIGLVRTGKGPATVVGYATIGEPIVYENEKAFRKDVNKHRVAKGSPFDIQDTKYGYPLLDVKRERKPFQPKGKGIVSRQMFALDAENDAQRLIDDYGWKRIEDAESWLSDDRSHGDERLALAASNVLKQSPTDTPLDTVNTFEELIEIGGAVVGAQKELVKEYVVAVLNERGRMENEEMFALDTNQDTRYLELAKNPKKNAQALQEMADEAATQAGSVAKVFRGDSEPFEVFDREKRGTQNKGFRSEDAFWFTASESDAEDYARRASKTYDRKNLKFTENPQALTRPFYLFGKMREMDFQDYQEQALGLSREGKTLFDDNTEVLKLTGGRDVPNMLKTGRDVAVDGKSLGTDPNGEFAEMFDTFFEDEAKGTKDEDREWTTRANVIEMLEFELSQPKEESLDKTLLNNLLDAIKNKEYDRITTTSPEYVDVYAVEKPNLIKSADPVVYDDNGNVIPLSKRFDTGQESIKFALDIGDTKQPFYSGVIKAITDKFPGKASYDQAKAFFKPGKTSGVKSAEVKYMGIDEFLDDHFENNKSITKKQIQEFAEANQLDVVATDFPNTYHGNFTLPGGGKYYEIAFKKKIKGQKEGLEPQVQTLFDRSDIIAMGEFPGVSGHFGGMKNILVHVRLSERTNDEGDKVLFIEEIQSDWAASFNKAEKSHEPSRLKEEIENEKARMSANARELANIIDSYPDSKKPSIISRAYKARLKHFADYFLDIANDPKKKEKYFVDLKDFEENQVSLRANYYQWEGETDTNIIFDKFIDILKRISGGDTQTLIEANIEITEFTKKYRLIDALEVDPFDPNSELETERDNLLETWRNSEASKLIDEQGLSNANDLFIPTKYSEQNILSIYSNPLGSEYGNFLDILSLRAAVEEVIAELFTSSDRFRETRVALQSITSLLDDLDDQNDRISRNENRLRSPRSSVADPGISKTYHEAALKQILRIAALNDFDAVAWSTGAQQIDLYNTRYRQNVEEINWSEQSSDGYVYISALSTNGREFDIGEIPLDRAITADDASVESLQGKTLNDIVGKRIADQIRNEIKEHREINDNREDLTHGTITGNNLSIGGQFHRTMYDVMVPSFLTNKKKGYLRKFGSQIEPIGISTRQELIDPRVANEVRANKTVDDLYKDLESYKADFDKEVAPIKDKIERLKKSIIKSNKKNKDNPRSEKGHKLWLEANLFAGIIEDLADYEIYVQDKFTYSDPNNNEESIWAYYTDGAGMMPGVEAPWMKKLPKELSTFFGGDTFDIGALEMGQIKRGDTAEFINRYWRRDALVEYVESWRGVASLGEGGFPSPGNLVNEKAGRDEILDYITSFDFNSYKDFLYDVWLSDHLDLMKRKFEGTILQNPSVRLNKEMKDTLKGEDVSIFALDPVEGKKLASVKGLDNFTQAMERAPSEAILGAYEHIPANDDNEPILDALGTKVDELLQPTSEENPVAREAQSNAATLIGGMIKAGEDKNLVDDLIQERKRLENYQDHKDLKAIIDDNSYESVVMGNPGSDPRTTRQNNLINLYNKYKSKPQSSYFKAASKALEKDFGSDWKDVAEGRDVQPIPTPFALDPDQELIGPDKLRKVSNRYKVKKGKTLPTAIVVSDTLTPQEAIDLSEDIDFNGRYREQAAYEINAQQVAQFPIMGRKGRKLAGQLKRTKDPDKRVYIADEIYETLIEKMQNNLRYLYNKMDKTLRKRAKLWYEGANRIAREFSNTYGLTLEKAAAIIATLSPQKDWFQNVSLAGRVIDIMTNQQDTKVTQEMVDMLVDIAGRKSKRDGESKAAHAARMVVEKREMRKKLKDLNYIGKKLKDLNNEHAAWFVRAYDEVNNSRSFPIISPEGDRVGIKTKADGTPSKVGWGSYGEIASAVGAFRSTTQAEFSSMLGDKHKVRNFYVNIVDPTNPKAITIDTHAVAAALFLPLAGASEEVSQNFGTRKGISSAGKVVGGHKGTYAVFHEAYLRTANELGILPRELQSITWEQVRTFFTDTRKGVKGFLDKVRGIWQNNDGNERSRQQVEKATRELNVAGTGQTYGLPDWAISERSEDGVGTRNISGLQKDKSTEVDRRSVAGRTGTGRRKRGQSTARGTQVNKFALDPSKLEEEFQAKENQRQQASDRLLESDETEKKKLREITKKTKASKRLALGFLFQGKYDRMDYGSSLYGGSGKAGEVTRKAADELAKKKKAVNEYARRVEIDIKSKLGLPVYKFIARKIKFRRFAADLHTYAARINATGVDSNGQFIFEGFDAPMGYISKGKADSKGLGPGSYVVRDGVVLRLGELNPEIDGYVLKQRITASEQKRFFNEFYDKYPGLAVFLERWINPHLKNFRYTASNDVDTPIFNRHALREVFGENELGDPGFVPGYTPDVARLTIIGSMVYKLKSMALMKGRSMGSIAPFRSGARTLKTGAAREQGAVANIFQGFNQRAYEAHQESVSRENSLKLLEAASKPLPEGADKPADHTRIDKSTINTLIKGLVQGMTKQSVGGKEFNEFFKEVIKDPSDPERLKRVLLNESSDEYSENELKIIRFMFGNEKAIKYINNDRIMDNYSYRQLVDSVHAGWQPGEILGKILGFIDGAISEMTVGLLTGTGTLFYNWLAPQIQQVHAASQAVARGLINGVSTDKGKREAADESFRTAYHIMKGIILRRFTNFEGFDWFLQADEKTGLSQPTKEDYDKGFRKLWKEGQKGKAIKVLTDRKRYYSQYVDRAYFDNNTLISAVQHNEIDEGIMRDLLNFRPGSALLRLARFSEYDISAKQNMAYAGYRAAAQRRSKIEAKKAKERGEKFNRRKWENEWMKTASETDPGIHKEAMGTALAFGFDYSNVPQVINDPNRVARTLQKGFLTFSSFMYSYGKLLLAKSPIGSTYKFAKAHREYHKTGMLPKDGLGGSERRNAIADLALWGMAMMLWRGISDEEENESPLVAGGVGRDTTIEGKEQPGWWTETGGKFNIDALPDWIGNSIRNVLTFYGADEADGMELWIRGRSIPYVNALSVQDLWIERLAAKLKGDTQKLKEMGHIVTETWDMANEFIPFSPITQTFIPTKYNKRQDFSQRVTNLLYDTTSSRIMPSPWRKLWARMVDPIYRRRSESSSLQAYPETPTSKAKEGYNKTLGQKVWNEILRTTPYASPSLPANGRTKSYTVDKDVKTIEDVIASRPDDIGVDLNILKNTYGLELEPNTGFTIDSTGSRKFHYVDPNRVIRTPRAVTMMNNVARIEWKNPHTRVLGELGIDDKGLKKLLTRKYNRELNLDKKENLTVDEEKVISAWNEYKLTEEYANSADMKNSAEQKQARRVQSEMTLKGTPKDDKGNEIKLPENFLSQLVRSQPRDMLANMVDPSTLDIIKIDRPDSYKLVQIREGDPKDPDNYVIRNIRKTSVSKKEKAMYNLRSGDSKKAKELKKQFYLPSEIKAGLKLAPSETR